ncbi:MAG: cation transporter [Melioribacteraceae bacterium]|nr:cation transporter [Melioribacteraceae bacterium]
MEKTFSIAGMSCNHCVMAVKTELSDANFNNFEVEVGSAKVEYETPEDESKIATAIEEAGFKVV